jgi:NTE family protein
MKDIGNVGLVLTGGGARSAYQAGVLRGIADILEPDFNKAFPFNILVGSSAGAINSAMLASNAMNFSAATQSLCRLWSEIRTEQVIRADVFSLGALGIRWLRDLSLGGLLGNSRSTHLLDAGPLREFLGQNIDFKKIRRHIKTGALHGLAVSATNYLTGATVIFFDGAPETEPWIRGSRIAQRTRLSLRHILASAAIPVFFQPVKLKNSYYGDGCVRLTTPISPAIHLGADRILAIGIRPKRSVEKTAELNARGRMARISLIDIAGVMLNAAFLDALDLDIERMRRINETAAGLTDQAHPSGLREIPLLVIQPSEDLGTLASEEFERFSNMLRYLLKGIGGSRDKGWDLLSYLAFDQVYTRHLIELGRADALVKRDEIRRFFDNE